MLKGLLSVLLRATEETPEYVGSRCLLEKQAVGGCDLCAAACPHDAIMLSDRAEIVPDACTGCGLCVQACPTGALEYQLPPLLGLLKDQGRARAGEEAVQATLKCSQVKGDGPTVNCLARVTPAALLASAAWGQDLDLIHGDCNTCRVGGPNVPRSLQEVIESARHYRETLGDGRLPARMVHWTGENLPPVPPAPPAPPVTRREAMGALFSGAKRVGAKVIPEQILPGVDTRVAAAPIPDEWVWRKRALRPAPEPITPQYWPIPTVDESCTMCPVCQNVCPTDAIKRELDVSGTYRLFLQVEACTGCEACQRSCPPSAIGMSETAPFEAIGGVILLREEKPVIGQAELSG